uniref:Uncharacterized protein n=1 Tax=Onchocerca volvulus TaxID=6282 RepID=A0A8R1U058_ONCVO
MVNWLLFIVIVNTVQFGLADSSLSYHPDYSKLSLHHLIIIAGAFVNLTIVLLAIIILFILRPKISPMIEEEQILEIPLDKKRMPKKLISMEKVQKLEKVWQFCPVEFSDNSTNSKTGDESIFTQITGTDDYVKTMFELPSNMTHIEGGQPVVFYFKEKKPQTAILPVYIMKEDENNLISSQTVLKTSPSQTISETPAEESLSAKKSSVTTSPSPSSSSSAIKRSNTGTVISE